MTQKYVYFFSKEQTDGNKTMKNFLGGKGANLAEMTSIGVPVPPGFTISTNVCDIYYKEGQTYPQYILDEIEASLQKLEKTMGKKLGDNSNPLLVSVRSGAAVSMPGMMDTVLNLGLNFDSVKGLAEKSGNERFAWDAFRRFVQMFGNVVMEMEHHDFEHILEAKKQEVGAAQDTDLSTEDLKDLVNKFMAAVKEKTGKDFPTDPRQQLQMSIDAVFGSWNNTRAIRYRELNNIKGLIGTAVNVQSMVYGNMGETSGTGVCFSRDPSTGENIFYGEYLMNAQGEDVVAGIRTPLELDTLNNVMPAAYKELCEIKDKLELHYTDMQDMEFTIEDKVLYFLQTRTGKRTAAAALKIAVDMVEEGLITKKEAVLRVDPNSLDQLLHPTFDEKAEKHTIATGLPASPGAALGKVVFSADEAEEWANRGEKVILVRIETSPEDLGGMHAAQGILTARGGMTSHAAVVARGMGTCCVAGCGDIKISYANKEFKVGDLTVKEGDYISLNGSTGEIYLGQVPTKEATLSGNFGTLMAWADEYRTLNVRTNADTPNDSKKAIEFGAEGIGLCRTEHMFFEEDKIFHFRKMILSETVENRKKCLDALLPIQQKDFEGIFEAMAGKPVTVRLLDPPLHEFVPHEDKEQKELAEAMNKTLEEVKQRVEELKEFNPMLGHRGCRLGITYPEIYEMQVRAIMQAAVAVTKKGMQVFPEIMIPLIGTYQELETLGGMARKLGDEIVAAADITLNFKVGTMLEIPRACLTANQVAEHAEFFSFGTNDLTQMTFGYSRDDAGVFLPEYVKKDVLDGDPFQALDQTGVGQLVEIGVCKGRSVKPNLKIGICGEHGGEPSSIEFCHRVGMNYVSCSPFRVPIARLAAAHAAIKQEKELLSRRSNM